MKILFITANGIEDAAYGGPKASIRNYKALQKYGKVDVYTIKKRSDMKSLISAFGGDFPPINKEDYRRLQIMKEENYQLVFFDGSYYGRLVDIFKDTKTVVFYHNCEHDFNKVRFGKNYSLKKFIYQCLIDKNEKYLTCRADYRIALSRRDAERIYNLYRKEIDLIVPLGIEDKFEHIETQPLEACCLLLGAVCPANIDGYKWFVDNVSPFINCKTVIAGKGFEEYRKDWQNDKVEVVGYVDSLPEVYAKASCVVIPLFSGAGMKIKTAEEIMYGKTIFGTEEAFSGFEFDIDGVAYQCDTSEEFIKQINKYLEKQETNYNENSRKIYLEKYSLSSTKKCFDKMISDM
jgi:hypothetical protein